MANKICRICTSQSPPSWGGLGAVNFCSNCGRQLSLIKVDRDDVFSMTVSWGSHRYDSVGDGLDRVLAEIPDWAKELRIFDIPWDECETADHIVFSPHIGRAIDAFNGDTVYLINDLQGVVVLNGPDEVATRYIYSDGAPII